LWDLFANWYVEYLKTDSTQLSFARTLLTQFIKLSHPFLPYETEVLWKEFVGSTNLLAFEKYDTTWSQGFRLKNSSNQFENIVSLLQNIRSTRGLFGIDPATKIEATTTSEQVLQYKQFLYLIAKIEVELVNPDQLSGYLIEIEDYRLSLDLLDYLEQPEQEIIKTKKQIENIHQQMATIQKILANPDFIQKAEEVVIQQKQNDLDLRDADLKNLNLKLQFLQSNQN
jgi:valyl-tRNA synthetase